jgi:hypothetical protein
MPCPKLCIHALLPRSKAHINRAGITASWARCFFKSIGAGAAFSLLVFDEILALDACDDRFGRGATKAA